MAPPIARNGRAIPGRLPWPPAMFPVAVPPSPMPSSLPSPIKWNPLRAFSCFSLFPSSPVAVPPLPAFSFSLSGADRPPAASPSSPERRPVAPSPPSASQPPPLPRRPCRAAQVRAGCAVSSLGVTASTSTPACPRFRRNAVARVGLALRLAGVPSATPSAVPVCRPTSPSPPPASQRGVFHAVLISVQLLLAVPCRLLAGPGRRRRRPPVVPGRRGVRPSVKPFSSVVRVRQVCRCSPVVVFVLASASSSLVPAASRLRPRIATEVVPSPFVSVVPGRLRRAHSSLSFPRHVAWW
uniref:Cell wall protein-like n=1 Tax=Oryza sativa subsp. japonica TaxID=39947 RepID=Q6ZJA8_ORYSJ|nr:cell wall protein-like [Oryza sativa Japonica Group]